MIQLKYNNFNQERQIGEYTIYLPDPPDFKTVANYNLPKEKQMFIPTPLPRGIEQWPTKDREAFEDAEWGKRRNGFWFMNNGNLEYISGTHYFYINWWKIDIGLPSFVDSDRDWYYLWKYTKDNPKARGMINIENRRGGKTWRGTSVVYDEISQTPNAHGGIQSKNNTDGGKVFQKLVFSWKKLPYFFKPVDIGESYPKSKIEFTEPSKRDTKRINKEYSLVLDSFIDFENAKEEAYDGTKQRVNYQDEIGKCVDVNVNERIQIVKECVMDGTKIIGKILATTTVEEMEKKGGKYCKLVWDGADPKNLLPNGETQNGLLRYFKPADYGLRGEDENGVPFINAYGYSDRERTKAYLERRRKAMKNRDDVTSDRRKYPLYIHDCWVQDNRKATYDTTKIEDQLEFNRDLPDTAIAIGDFHWRNGEKDTSVEFHHDKNGRWKILWMPPALERNKQLIRGNKKAPGNTDQGCFGLDPYDNKVTVDDRKSDAAAYGFRRFDPLNPKESGIFIVEYVNRPKLPEIMWEDMIKMCVFYGWEILIESQKQGTINYFRMRGYERYLMFTDNPEIPGVAMTTDTQQAIIYATESYIASKVGYIEEEGQAPYMGRCYFDKLLNCWLEFDFDQKWTKFDSMVGAGLALLGSRKKVQMIKPKFNAGGFMPRYRISGNRSKLIQTKIKKK
jgi:hypothetical protein